MNKLPEEILSSVFDHLDVGLALFDSDFKILIWNEQLSRLSKLPAVDVVGKSLFAACPKLNESARKVRVQSVIENGVPAIFSSKIHKSILNLPKSEKIFQESTISLITDEKSRRRFGLLTIKDVTSLTHKVERAFHESQIKSRFLANMSHEIRTPLNCVLGMAELLSDTNLSDHQKPLLNDILLSGKDLLVVVNDVLDFAKMEAGKLVIDRKEVDVVQCVESVVNSFRRQSAKAGVNLTIENLNEVPKTIVSDNTRLKQILFNLIGNAVKFTDSGSVKVSTSYQKIKSKTGEVKISVSDTGCGISEEDLKLLFNPFEQVQNANKPGIGTGLGLVICKKLADLLGGEISVSSSLGQGSTFTFTFQTDTMDESIKKSGLEAGSFPVTSYHHIKVLVAEDNNLNQKFVTMVLRKFSITPDIANDGSKAVSMATSKDYDLILMDYRMPNMNGIEAALAIKQKLAERCPPIVALTASTMADEIDRFRSAGMLEVISKPFSKARIAEVLFKLFGTREIPRIA